MKRLPTSSRDRPRESSNPQADRKRRACPPLYQVVVECRDEREQRALYEQLRQKGFSCRLLML